MHIILCTHIVVEWKKTYVDSRTRTVFGKNLPVTFSRFYSFGGMKCVLSPFIFSIFLVNLPWPLLGPIQFAIHLCDTLNRFLIMHATARIRKKINLLDVSFTLQRGNACVCAHWVCVCIKKCNKWNEIWNWMERKIWCDSSNFYECCWCLVESYRNQNWPIQFGALINMVC